MEHRTKQRKEAENMKTCVEIYSRIRLHEASQNDLEWLSQYAIDLELELGCSREVRQADNDELNSVITKKNRRIKELEAYEHGYLYLKDKYEAIKTD